jgi:hypothetical protein
VGDLLWDLEPFLIALFFAIRELPFGTCGAYFLYGFLWGFFGFGQVSGCNILGWFFCYLDWLYFWIWGVFYDIFLRRFLGFTGVFWI